MNETRRTTGHKRAHGEGTITHRKDGRWEGRLSLPDGKRKVLYGKTQHEVKAKLLQARHDLAKGFPVRAGQQQTLAEYLDTWLTDVVKPSTRPLTYEGYGRIVRLHLAPTLGRLALDQVTPQRIQALQNAKLAAGQSPRSVQYMRAVLRRALGQALKWGLIARNPVALVDTPRQVRHETRTLSPAEARTLMTALDGDRLESLVTLTLTLGLRRGEVLGLHWSDVNLDSGLLTVRGQYQRADGIWQYVEPKSDSSRRTLALPVYVVASLRAHRTHQLEERLAAGEAWTEREIIFPTAVGAPQDGGSLSHQFANRVKRAGLAPIPFHGLRHSAATLLLARGLSIGEIQKVLGHSQISLTANLYAHAAPEIMTRAADHMEALFGAR